MFQILEKWLKHGMIKKKSIIVIKRRRIIANEERGQRGSGKDKPLINERIRAREVRLIDENGNNHGIVPTSQAMKMADEVDEKLQELNFIRTNTSPAVYDQILQKYGITITFEVRYNSITTSFNLK